MGLMIRKLWAAILRFFNTDAEKRIGRGFASAALTNEIIAALSPLKEMSFSGKKMRVEIGPGTFKYRGMKHNEKP